MACVEIEERILEDWGTLKDRLGVELEEIYNYLDQIELKEEGFVNPDEENLIQAVLFCSWLDPTVLLEFFRPAYSYFAYIKERLVSRTRFLSFLCLSRSNTIAEAYRKLTPDGFQLLGFDSKPTYELLREFVNERLGAYRFSEFLDALISQIREMLFHEGIELGKRDGQDASDEPSLKHDPEAKYSGYYKEYGYKFDVVHDLDQETLPLYYVPMEITEDEGADLVPAQEHLRSLEMEPAEWKVDGKYATYENIAKSEVEGTHLVYKVQRGWVYNPKGDTNEIMRLYQKCWKEENFKVDADMDYMLRSLLDHGESEAVGAYFRNVQMKRAEHEAKEIAEECGERSGKTEGFIGVAKKETILGRRLPRRGAKTFTWVLGIAMMTFAFAALIRLQNGVFDRLGNLTYIT